MNQMDAAGPEAFAGPVRHVYVHVPFCRAKCDYCDFASQPVGDVPDGALLDAYVAAVAAEWQRERAAHGVRRLLTLYLGGGTPSLLGPERLARLLDPFRPFLTPAAEVTVEANPEDVDARFAAWAGTAVGGPGGPRPARISLGVQSFSPRLRAAVGRRAAADPAAAAARLRAAGVDNLSLDLMWGLPGQSAADLEDDLGAVLALRPAHVSWYELTVVEGTPLARRLGQPQCAAPVACADPTAAAMPSPDERAAMYRRIVRALQRAGYAWYEVSNYALPGRRARHNVAYWRARPYLGLGPGAVSTLGERRWTNTPDVAAWRARLAAAAPPPRETELLDARTRAREQLMLAARCGLRLPLAALAGILDERAAAALAGAGLVSLAGATIRVTRKGRYVADEVCVRLFRD